MCIAVLVLPHLTTQLLPSMLSVLSMLPTIFQFVIKHGHEFCALPDLAESLYTIVNSVAAYECESVRATVHSTSRFRMSNRKFLQYPFSNILQLL